MMKLLRKSMFPIILLALSAVFMLFFSTTTSPLYPNYYGVDSAFYRVIGASILQGKTLYTDIWDNKGPVLFFIQAIGALTGTENAGISNVFILQITAFFLTVLILYKAARLTGSGKGENIRFLLIVIAACTILCTAMEGGNLCEEWSLPFISCSLYLFALYAAQTDSHPAHPSAYAFIHGVCFAMIAFIRINNAISICAGILVIGLYLIYKKQWKNILKNALFGILGILTVTIPILIYFRSNNALQDMIYGVFLHNLKYVGDRSHKNFTGIELLIRYAPIIASFLMIILSLLRKWSVRMIDIMMLGIVTGNTLILWQSNKYLHYFTIIVPVFILILILYADLHSIPGLLITFAVMILFIHQDASTVSRLSEIHALPPKYVDASQIPETEKQSAIGIWTTPDIYLNTGFKPISRFCAYQFIHFPVEPAMLDEFINDLKTKQPKWIMVLSGYEGIYPEVEEMLDSDYQFKFSEDNTDFFRRIEP